MLKKKAGFKPKAPIRRNVPTTSSQDPERSATAEQKSTTPAQVAVPVAVPVPTSDQSAPTSTPTPSLAQPRAPEASPSTHEAESRHKAPISMYSSVSPSAEIAGPPQSEQAPTVRTIEHGDVREPPAPEPPIEATSGVADALQVTTKEVQSTEKIPTQSAEASTRRDATSDALAPPAKGPASARIEPILATTTPPTAAPVESNIDPALRIIVSTAPTQASTATTASSSTPTLPPNLTTAATRLSNPASSVTTQPGSAQQYRATQTAPRPATQAATPPAEAIADQPQPSIEASGETGDGGPSTAPKSKPGRKRKSAAEAAGGDAAAGSAKKRPRKKKAEGQEAQVGEGNQAGAPRKRVQKRKITTGEEQTGNEEGEGGDGGQQSAKAGRHRSVTPEDAEAIEIDIRQVKMGDLVKDMRVGKKFSRHDELLERERMKRQKNYVAKRLKETGLDSLSNGGDGASRAGSSAATPAPGQNEASAIPKEGEAAGAAAPQFQIIDGQIVLNSDSLQFDRHAHAAEEAGEMEEEIEDEFTHHTTSSSYSKRPVKGNSWSPAETEKFYMALRMIGADFQIISRMFPGKTRRHIKLKFNREERLRPQRINAALVGTKTVAMDLDEYKSHTGEEYETVDAITAEHRRAEEEFEAEQRRVDDEAADEARRKREELFADNGAGDSGKGAAGQRAKGRGGGGRRKKAPVSAGLGG
ncbi:hypothetical protein QBC33DRAFT_341098 [Phialemonium atrogriseum]|uniref:Myb-like domain-containing protein n=1 Tax=Phialemonium atrogriseum TaxID=1093897 RepID=A0AAJ0C3Z2_9PEZI|nr:uncharacterized protein QBC33DRAFT_341098 [Phialemonium atrogriseum]KAK1769082.1 hypothetical protein QBC33DRAFT_341098 [Phialemonium atrogriseum]